MPKQPSDIDVIVTLSAEDLSRMDEVSAELQAQGLKVSKSLASIGTILGSVPSQTMAKLGKVRGVAGVEPSGEVHIPPPDSDVQ